MSTCRELLLILTCGFLPPRDESGTPLAASGRCLAVIADTSLCRYVDRVKEGTHIHGYANKASN